MIAKSSLKLRQGLKRPGCAAGGTEAQRTREKPARAPQLKFSDNIATCIRNNPVNWAEHEYFL
jgi:hypothetical protein